MGRREPGELAAMVTVCDMAAHPPVVGVTAFTEMIGVN
jgi:hypothetical protein